MLRNSVTSSAPCLLERRAVSSHCADSSEFLGDAIGKVPLVGPSGGQALPGAGKFMNNELALKFLAE